MTYEEYLAVKQARVPQAPVPTLPSSSGGMSYDDYLKYKAAKISTPTPTPAMELKLPSIEEPLVPFEQSPIARALTRRTERGEEVRVPVLSTPWGMAAGKITPKQLRDATDLPPLEALKKVALGPSNLTKDIVEELSEPAQVIRNAWDMYTKARIWDLPEQTAEEMQFIEQATEPLKYARGPLPKPATRFFTPGEEEIVRKITPGILGTGVGIAKATLRDIPVGLVTAFQEASLSGPEFEAKYGGRSREDVFVNSITEQGWEFIQGMAEFQGKPLGAYGFKAAKEQWRKDPGGSAIAVASVILPWLRSRAQTAEFKRATVRREMYPEEYPELKIGETRKIYPERYKREAEVTKSALKEDEISRFERQMAEARGEIAPKEPSDLPTTPFVGPKIPRIAPTTPTIEIAPKAEEIPTAREPDIIPKLREMVAKGEPLTKSEQKIWADWQRKKGKKPKKVEPTPTPTPTSVAEPITPPVEPTPIVPETMEEITADVATKAAELEIPKLEKVVAEQQRRITQMEEDYKNLYGEVVTDPLTSHLNRRGLDELAPKIIERAKTEGYPVTVMSGDVRKLKEINDNLGEDVGDSVLLAVGEELDAINSGSTDIKIRAATALDRVGEERAGVARPKGDEFYSLSYIKPSQAMKMRKQIEERINQAIADTGVNEALKERLGEKYTGPITFNLGIASSIAKDLTTFEVLSKEAHVSREKAKAKAYAEAGETRRGAHAPIVADKAPPLPRQIVKKVVTETLTKKAKRDARKAMKEKLDKIDMELDEMLASPEEEKAAATTHPFNQSLEVTLQRSQSYTDPEKLKGSPDSQIGYLINEVNKWRYGGDVDIVGARRVLGEMAADPKRYNTKAESSLDLEAFRNRAAQAYKWSMKTERVEAKPKEGVKLTVGGDLEGAWNLINKSMKELREASETGLKGSIDEAVKRWGRLWVDASGRTRNDLTNWLLKNRSEPLAQLAYATMSLMRGGGAIAAHTFKNAYGAIYKGMGPFSSDIRHLLDTVIFNRRVIQIDDIHGVGKKKHPKGVTSKQAQDWLKYLEVTNPELSKLLNARADRFFDEARNMLDLLYEEGLIDQATHDRLIKFDYHRREMIDQIDPIITFPGFRQGTAVPDSGIERLATGKEEDVLQTDSRVLLAEIIGRTYARVYKNKANKFMLSLAAFDKENPFVRLKKPARHGWHEVPMYVNGEKLKLYMSTDTFKDWALRDVDITYKMSQALRYWSAGFITRPMATGINFVFGLAQIPMDLAHIWASSQMLLDRKWVSTYSPSRAPLQMLTDIATVFPDVLMRKGRYVDALIDGMGMELLVHQGRMLTRRLGHGFATEPLMNALGYISETGELLTRIALRERALKRLAKKYGKKLEDVRGDPFYRKLASSTARDYLDFAQGGSGAKAIDAAIPYFNAGIQANRGLLRAIKRNPTEAAYKLFLLGFTVYGLERAFKANAPKLYDAMDDDEARRNWTLPIFGDTYFYDPDGNKRYVYLKVPKDKSAMFITEMLRWLTKASMGEDYDPVQVAKGFAQLLPADTSSLPPSVAAALGVATNTDFWAAKKITYREGLKPQYQVEPGVTSKFATNIGQATGFISPEKLDYALGEIFTKNNVYTALAGKVWAEMFGGLQQDQKEQALAYMLATNPLTKRFFGMTNPTKNVAKAAAKYEMDEDSRRAVNVANVDFLYDAFKLGNLKKTDIMTYVRENAVDKAEVDKLVNQVVFNDLIGGLEEKALWRKVNWMSKTGRARYFLNEYLRADPERRATIYKELPMVPKIDSVQLVKDVVMAAKEVGIAPDKIWTHPRTVNDLEFEVKIPKLMY